MSTWQKSEKQLENRIASSDITEGFFHLLRLDYCGEEVERGEELEIHLWYHNIIPDGGSV